MEKLRGYPALGGFCRAQVLLFVPTPIVTTVQVTFIQSQIETLWELEEPISDKKILPVFAEERQQV